MPIDRAVTESLDNAISAGREVVPEGSDPAGGANSATSEQEATNEAIAEALAVIDGKGKAPAKKVEPESEPEPEAESEEEPAVDEEKKEEEAEEEPEAEEDEEPADEEEEPDDKAKKAELDFAERFNKLAQQEKRVLREREDAKKLVTESATKVKTLQDKQAELESAINMLEVNPIRALKTLGKDFKKIADRVIELSKNPTVALEDELRAMREDTDRKLENERKRLEEERKSETAKVAEQKRELDRQETVHFIVSRIDEAPDDFELIRAKGMSEQVAQDIWEHFNKTGQVVKYHDYLTFVEKKLEEEAESLLKTKKLAAKYKAAEVEEEAPEDEEPEPRPKPKAKTLSSRVNGRAAPAKTKHRSPKESTGDAEMDELVRKYLD